MPVKEYKVFDIFMFKDEFDMLDIRLNSLKSFVDTFVLVESTKPWNGETKPLYFNESKNKEYYIKNFNIIHIIVDNCEYNKYEDREWYQWAFALEKLSTICNDNDIIILSDVDEIPDLEIYDFKTDVVFDLAYMLYWLNTLRIKEPTFPGTVITKYKNIRSSTILEYTEKAILYRSYVRFGRAEEASPPIENFKRIKGGWHYCWLTGLDENKILNKLDTYGHQEDHNTIDIRNNALNRLKNLNDILGRGDLQVKELEGPKWLLENKDKFENYIYDETKNKKPTVALVMIVKNEEEILEKSLRSVKDIVDEFIIVDTGSIDKTKSIIKKYGKLYEVPFEDFVTTKNKALEIAKDKSEYILFMDADEVLYKGKDILRKIAEEGKVECVSCKITEGPAEDYNNISNQYERARMWRNDGKWTFHGKKVHEYIYGGESINFVDEILVRHEHLKSTKEEDNKKRYIQYIKWLEENVEEDPKDSRSWFYLARSYVDTKQLEEAIICYNKYLKIIENDFVDERWQSSYDIANCYMNLGEFDKALEWCKTANLIDNRRAEHFVLAGFIYYTLKDFKKAIEQYEQAIKPIPNVLLFQKPLEYNVIPNDYLSVCYFSLGDFKKALYYSNENKKLNKEVSANDYWYERRNHIPIWLIAGNTPEPIYGGILNERGVHGVETAYIELAKHLAKLGHKIYLFCNTEKEHVYDNVLYTPYYNIGLYTALQEHHPDILITSREINTLYFNIPAIKILWQQDAFLPHLSSFPEYEKRIDAVVCSSKWHKNYIYQSNFLKFEKDTVNIIPLGIDKSLYAIPTEKERYKVMYNSSPDRGLDTLVNMWDEITRRIPQINLYVTYGWDSMKKWSKEIEEKAKLHENKTFKNIDEYKNIHFTGRLTKKELMQHQMSSELLLYPNTHFYETYCLSVLEAQAAGMVVVTSDVGALSTTTLRENNFLLIGTGGNKFYDNEYINTVEYILNNPEELKRKSENNRNTIMNGEYDWSDVAKQWESLFFNLLKGR